MALTTSAGAHAVLVSAEPADGSIVEAAPPALTLHFDEAVAVGALVLIDARGRKRDRLQPEAAGSVVVVRLPSDLPRGSQLLSYRVISGDGHPVAGTVSFAVGSRSSMDAAIERDRWRDGLIWSARLGLYAGLFFGVGGVFFLRWLGRATAARPLVIVLLAVGLAAALLSVAGQGLDLLDLPLGSLFTPGPWIAAADTSLMSSVLVAAAAMAVALAAMCMAGDRWSRPLAAIALAGVGAALMLSGHASTAEPQWLNRTAVVIHGMAVAFWLGALVPLAMLVVTADADARTALHRFSVTAVPIVGVLLLSGVWLATAEVKSLNALVETTYGQLLAIKLALVVLLLILAALNRYRLVPAFTADPASPALGRSILLECVLGVAILGVVAGWRFTPPPRSFVPEAPLGLHIHGERAMFQVVVFPGRVGLDRFLLQLMNADGSRLQLKEVTLTLQMPAGGVGPFERKAVLGQDQDWHVRDVPLPLAGRWHVRIDALIDDFDQISLEDEFELRPR
ncbi:copper resistance CopC/CopD family protein [Bradyrhizobium sp. HKCCYLS2038]|uniref:copper resistance CopC/CopD family protein n=1 Tax=unclassified Bradyrhizobium TaxID=2631580 RepID=UPI003EBFB032